MCLRPVARHVSFDEWEAYLRVESRASDFSTRSRGRRPGEPARRNCGRHVRVRVLDQRQVLPDEIAFVRRRHAPVLEEDLALGNMALDLVDSRKSEYKKNGISYYQPWVFLITDGAPTDEWKAAAERVRSEMTARRLMFFAVGVRNADMDVLTRITPRALKLDGLRFNDLFLWLSQSQKRVSGSKPGDQTALPPLDFGAPVTA